MSSLPVPHDPHGPPAAELPPAEAHDASPAAVVPPLPGAPPTLGVRLPDDSDLRVLLVRARAHDDAPLRDLVEGYVTLRHALRDVLAVLAAREGGAAIANVPALQRARALVSARHAHADGDAR